MKKLLVFILLLISVTSTLVPCCLKDNCNDDELVATNKKEGRPEGSCSPFFACGTCAVFAVLSKHVHISLPAIENSVHHETMVLVALHKYSANFWQPPRSC